MAKKPKQQGKPEAAKSAVVVPTTGALVQGLQAKGFTVKRQVTMPTLSMKETGASRILQFNEAMHVSTYKDPDPSKAKEKPATVAAVTDMESGEVLQFLVPSVVQSQLEREYPEQAYVTKVFQITCQGKRPSKRYRDFTIIEVEQKAA